MKKLIYILLVFGLLSFVTKAQDLKKGDIKRNYYDSVAQWGLVQYNTLELPSATYYKVDFTKALIIDSLFRKKQFPDSIKNGNYTPFTFIKRYPDNKIIIVGCIGDDGLIDCCTAQDFYFYSSGTLAAIQNTRIVYDRFYDYSGDITALYNEEGNYTGYIIEGQFETEYAKESFCNRNPDLERFEKQATRFEKWNIDSLLKYNNVMFSEDEVKKVLKAFKK